MARYGNDFDRDRWGTRGYGQGGGWGEPGEYGGMGSDAYEDRWSTSGRGYLNNRGGFSDFGSGGGAYDVGYGSNYGGYGGGAGYGGAGRGGGAGGGGTYGGYYGPYGADYFGQTGGYPGGGYGGGGYGGGGYGAGGTGGHQSGSYGGGYGGTDWNRGGSYGGGTGFGERGFQGGQGQGQSFGGGFGTGQQGQQGQLGSMRAGDLMTENPETVTPEATLADAAKKMRELDVGIIPVVDGQESRRLRGVVTDRDIAIRAVAEGKDVSKTKVSDVMTTDVETCNKNDSVQDVLNLMEREQVRRVPITDREGRLVGIIAQADVATDLTGRRGQREVADTVERISEPGRPRQRGGGGRASQSRGGMNQGAQMSATGGQNRGRTGTQNDQNTGNQNG